MHHQESSWREETGPEFVTSSDLKVSDVFETRKATGSELFSFLTRLHATTFILLSFFSP